MSTLLRLWRAVQRAHKTFSDWMDSAQVESFTRAQAEGRLVPINISKRWMNFCRSPFAGLVYALVPGGVAAA